MSNSLCHGNALIPLTYYQMILFNSEFSREDFMWAFQQPWERGCYYPYIVGGESSLLELNQVAQGQNLDNWKASSLDVQASSLVCFLFNCAASSGEYDFLCISHLDAHLINSCAFFYLPLGWGTNQTFLSPCTSLSSWVPTVQKVKSTQKSIREH